MTSSTERLAGGPGASVEFTRYSQAGQFSLQSRGTTGLLWSAAAATDYELHRAGHLTGHAIAMADPSAAPASLYWKAENEKAVEIPRIAPGSVFIRSEQLATAGRWRNARLAIVTISPEFMERSMPEPFTRPPVNLLPTWGGAPDPVLAHLLEAIGVEAAGGFPAGKLFFETLGSSLALYAAVRFGMESPRIEKYASGLSVERRVRVLDYINHRLGGDLTIRELAGIANLSPYHFNKMFQKSMGQSVHRYVLECRLNRARELLLSDDLNVAEVALAVGFSGQSQFTVAFRRHFGTTPRRYRQLNAARSRKSIGA